MCTWCATVAIAKATETPCSGQFEIQQITTRNHIPNTHGQPLNWQFIVITQSTSLSSSAPQSSAIDAPPDLSLTSVFLSVKRGSNPACRSRCCCCCRCRRRCCRSRRLTHRLVLAPGLPLANPTAVAGCAAASTDAAAPTHQLRL